MKKSKKKVVFGLGNYGNLYSKTRHNIGFDLLKNVSDYFSREENSKEDFKNREKWEFLLKKTENGEEIFFVKVKGFINDSGILIKKFMKSLELGIEDIILIYDDVSMDFGKVRFKRNSSSGGHNGVKSVIENLGSESFCRIKIGVGIEKPGRLKEWVLGKFTKEENEKMNEISQKVADNLAAWIGGRI